MNKPATPILHSMTGCDANMSGAVKNSAGVIFRGKYGRDEMKSPINVRCCIKKSSTPSSEDSDNVP